ncbi:MAG: symmetrical bis(5'-nucleosyl)-tetraphosphatase [Magnetococcales bacterium]|nr:symmetrical bis(5'-nucleosyl)-tetraphosphatase [Magnetococcales bacterium]
MAVYAIGDVHGCLPQLLELLEAIRFRPARDRLWFVGDIINRGPDSLGTLRFVRDLGDRAVTLMGNHELRAISGLSGHGDRAFANQMGFFAQAPDLPEIHQWLRGLPLMHHDAGLGAMMVHAGFFPGWSFHRARELADRLQEILRDDRRISTLFSSASSSLPDLEPVVTEEMASLHFALAVMTRMRICQPDGRVVWSIPGEKSGMAFRLEPDSPYRPWYELLDWPGEERVVYGHWAVAGLSLNGRFKGLDSGCVYGGRLSAIRLDHPETPVTQVTCPCYVAPE